MKRLYTFIAVAFMLSTVSFSQSKIDSILNYKFASTTDSTLNAKKHYDTYDNNGNLTHKVTYLRKDNSWQIEYEESYEYGADGITVYQKTYADHVGDVRVKYNYDKDGNLTEEVAYSNKNEGELLDPEWERALKKEYSYTTEGINDTVVVSAFVKYWQPARKIGYDYDAGKVITENVYKWLPEVKIKEFEGVYGQNASATANYLYRAYKVEQSISSIDDLDTIIIPAGTTVVNIFKADGTRINYNDSPAGKTLKEILNDPSVNVTDINQLRDNYREWFKTVDDANVTLLNINIKAGRPFDIQEVVKTTTDLYSYTDNDGHNLEYLNTAYWVKGAASMDDLLNVTLPSDIDWVNIYVKSDGSEGKKYRRIDISGADAAGKTLNAVFGDSITVEDLYQSFEEWFYDKDNKRKLVRLNVKAMKKSPTGSTAIDAYYKLYSKSDDNQFVLNAYKVNSGATADDLKGIIISDNAEKVIIYKGDGTNTQIFNSQHPIHGKSLYEIFGDSISPSNLIMTRNEWFYTSEGQIVLLNINVKEEKNIGSTEKVKVTENLYNIGTSVDELIYENTAFMVEPDATVDDLENYTIPADADYVVVKRTLGRSDTYTGQAGKTLKQFMSDNSLTINSLRQNYWEWFVNENKRRTLVKLNIKAYREVQPVPVLVVDSVFTTSSSRVYACVAYKVAEIATDAELNAIALPANMQWLDYYIDGESSSLHPKAGASVSTLGDILKAENNDEGITITPDQLRQNYVEWLINNEGKTKLYKINLKAVTQVNDGSLTLTKTTSISYDTNGKEAVKTVSNNVDVPAKRTDTQIQYTYASGDLVMEEEFISTDNGSNWDKNRKKTYFIDDKGDLRVVSYYGFSTDADDYILDSKDFYFYEGDTPTAIDDKEADTKLSTSFYPNPVSNVLNIHVQNATSFTYRIFSLDGAAVLTGNAYSGNTTIDVSGLKAGVYIMNIVSGNKTYTTKIVKK